MSRIATVFAAALLAAPVMSRGATTTTVVTLPGSTTTSTTVPLGADDPGCVPATKANLKCGDALAKALTKAGAAVIKCHKKQADDSFKNVAAAIAGAAEDTCSENNGGKSAKEKLDAAVTKVSSLCSTSQMNGITLAESILFADKTNAASLDALNGSIYCDGTVDIDPTGDDAGKIPSDKNALACEDAVGAALAKAFGAGVKCHAKVADMLFAGKTFDEEACEDLDPVNHKSAHEKYSAAMDKLDAKNVCTKPCLTRSARDLLGTQIFGLLEALTAITYPCN